MSPLADSNIPGQFNGYDLMGNRISGYDQPRSVALLMVPEFAVLTGRIVAQVDMVVKLFGGVLVVPVGSIDQAGVTEAHEFGGVPRSQQWMYDYHRSLPFNAGLVGRRRPFRQ